MRFSSDHAWHLAACFLLVGGLRATDAFAAATLDNTCNANVTNASAVFSSPETPRPEYLVPAIDPTFGTTVTRIGGNSGTSTAPVAGTFGSDVRHHYHTDPPWNSDGTLYAIQNESGGSPSVLYLDGQTYVPRYGKCSNYSLGDDWWNPNPAHPHERINVNGNRLSWFDVTTCTETRFWTLPFTGAQSKTEGTSWDGKYTPITDSTGKQVVIVEMDPASGRVGPAHDVTTDCGANRSSLCDVTYIDYLAVSPSGKYLVVWYNDQDYTRVYDINPSTLAITPRPTSTAHFSGCHGTSDDGYVYDVGESSASINPFDSNEDVVVGQEQCGNKNNGTVLDSQGKRLGTVILVRLKDGQITALTDPINEGDGRHVSAVSQDNPGWAYVSYHSSWGGTRFRGEIVAVKMDGSLAVKRLAHSHTDYGSYRSEAHAVPSRDGLRVAFASSWSLNCGSSCGSTHNPQDYVVDVCATGPCAGAPTGTVCSDGNACSQTDTCQNGVCTGGNPVVCTASDLCHTAGICSPATGTCSNPGICTASDACHVVGTCALETGICSNPAAPDGTACADGDACTRTDACQSGVCTGANPVVCSASDACHVAGTCDPTTGTCSNPVAPDGTVCSDACTPEGLCLSAVCTGPMSTACTASDACHEAGTCNPATGVCSNPAKPSGTACIDGDACTRTDACQSGVCTGANPVVCSASDACHVAGTCDPTTGTCSNPVAPDGTVCSDACTPEGLCLSAVCTGPMSTACTASDACHEAGTCNPATGVCSNPAKPSGTVCNDGNACTQADTCESGVCTGSNPVVCTASDVCHEAGTCNPATGACSDPAKSNGAACTDGNACTTGDVCSGGTCVGGPPPSCPSLAFVKDVATNASATTGTSISLAVPIGGVAAGNSVIVTLAMADASGPVSATDTSGNVYEIAADVLNSSHVRTVILAAHNVVPLSVGSTMTITHPSVAGRAVSASEFSGLGPTGALDRTSTASGTSTTPSSGFTTGTTVADELLIGAIGVQGPLTDAFTAAANYTALPRAGTASLPIAFRAVASAFTNSTSLAISGPASTVPNDVMLASIDARGGTGTAITAPSGWTLVRRDNSGTRLAKATYYKVAGASEPASYTWTFSPSVRASGGIVAYSNVATTTPINVSGGQVNASSTTVTAPSITTTVANAMLVGLFGTAAGTRFTAPLDMAERYDLTTGSTANGTSSEGVDATQAAAGGSGAKSATAGVADVNIGHLVALTPMAISSDSEYRLVSATGVYSADGTISPSQSWAAAIATFKHPACPCSDPCMLLNCDDGDACTDDSCGPDTGCVHVANTASCNDGNACTTGDACSDGLCVGGGALNCNDNNPCTDDSCSPTAGCAHANNTVACDDGNACTQADTCQSGVCLGSNPVVCSASDACHDAGTCDPATGICSNPVAPDGTGCSDGNACTPTDSCQGGACTGSSPVVCAASDACHEAGTCNPATGVCSNPTATDGIACDDGNACTDNDACNGGICLGQRSPSPAEVDESVRIAQIAGIATISWSPALGSTWSDVLRGLVSALPVGPGGGDEVCLISGTSNAFATDPEIPNPGDGFWYLVQGTNACAAGSYGVQVQNGVSTPRSSATCP